MIETLQPPFRETISSPICLDSHLMHNNRWLVWHDDGISTVTAGNGPCLYPLFKRHLYSAQASNLWNTRPVQKKSGSSDLVFKTDSLRTLLFFVITFIGCPWNCFQVIIQVRVYFPCLVFSMLVTRQFPFLPGFRQGVTLFEWNGFSIFIVVVDIISSDLKWFQVFIDRS